MFGVISALLLLAAIAFIMHWGRARDLKDPLTVLERRINVAERKVMLERAIFLQQQQDSAATAAAVPPMTPTGSRSMPIMGRR